MSRIPVRRGVSVVALLTGPSAAKGIPHVTGVRTIDGEEVFADLVVDATALVAACPLHAHWLDGEPITDVLSMGGIIDRYRRFVVDGVPVATGIVSGRHSASGPRTITTLTANA
jgi:hypothetical protein